MKKRLTIFTPTYNRAYILPKLYESLCCQTCQDFEWQVVDDGSTDNTKELVNRWIRENKVEIKYYYCPNGGKMRATNMAARHAVSELFVCIDSDDCLSNNNAVRDSLAFWDGRNEFLKTTSLSYPVCGMISRKRNPMKTISMELGEPFVGTCLDIDVTYREESTIFVMTDIIKQYPYPEFEGEKFITDIYMYDAISEKHRFIYHPYYFQDVEYQINGYTSNFRKLLFSNPRGHREYHRLQIRLKKENYWKNVINYISMSLFVRDHTMFSASPNKFLTVLLYPLGVLKFAYDKYQLCKEG